LTSRAVGWGALGGAVLLAALIGIAWRGGSAAWFLLFPVLVIGVLAAGTLGALWALRHF
jgi:hypothetical protein